MYTFPPTCGLCGGASNEGFPPLLRGKSPDCWTGPDICFGALIAGRPFLFVRRDIPFPLSSDMLREKLIGAKLSFTFIPIVGPSSEISVVQLQLPWRLALK
jgi:hypothetical protein